ncbi:polysaccharide lyase family 14 protein, partial [Rhodotorula graminis WP1]
AQQVAFDPTFDFVKGGKLPGLSGTSSSRHGRTLCVGGRHLDSCVSARLMWRPQGLGEVYAYVPTYAGFCEEGQRRGDVACDKAFGTSLSRGSFRFERARWHTITQLVSLNDPPLANGLLHLYLDDHLVLSHTDILWRTNPNVTLDAVLFSTFFGGGDDTYNSPTSPAATSYFRRFEV